MHQFIIDTVVAWNQNKLFRFMSSIRMAVPVMLLLILAIAVGTGLESVYSAEIAKLAVYDSAWFNVLLGFLGVNIFTSMISRYPWKERHIGFVITHIGILILLGGSWVTKIYGIDGSMQIPEGQSSSTVIMPQLMLAYQFDGSPTGNQVQFSKPLFDKEGSALDDLNENFESLFTIEKLYSFAEINKGYSSGSGDASGPIGVGFQLKSAFFDVKEWLHSENQPILQMGPATIKLIIDESGTATKGKTRAAIAEKRPSSAVKTSNQIVLKNVQSGETVRSFSLSEMEKGLRYKNLELKVIKIFKRAIVADNKIAENLDPTGPANPAVELLVKQDSKEIREILYAKFPNFSVHESGIFGFRFEFQAGETESAELPAGHPPADMGDS
ncbi:MAG: cytochrome c biogenesis protein ResB, partial [Pseudobdellovibrionaceae bacterium]